MDEPLRETLWRQVNIAYPGNRPQRERHAIGHLARVLLAAEADRLITSWWWIRKGPWRVRYLLTEESGGHDPMHPLLTAGVTWTGDIYEPETHAFGGKAGMEAAHTLFHRDSRHLLSYLHDRPTDRREHSLVLCTALMRAAGMEWNEQGDVWARVAEQRDGLQPHAPNRQAWASFVGDVRHLLLGTARTDTIAGDWLTAFTDTGAALRTLRETGRLTRGLRAVIALHVIFHLNRIGIPATTQATLAQAAKDAVFGSPPIVVAGPHVMSGYWGLPEETERAFTDGWFRTGDAARLDEDGYAYVVDRIKDMIISGGENIYPAEVENALLANPDVVECAVIGVPHERWGETGRAIVVAREGSGLTAERVLDSLAGRLARYKLPTSVVFADEIPRNGTGKILKARLRTLYGPNDA